MKSRQKFFNPTAFRMNVTRFAPAWVLYTIFLLLMMSMVLGGNTDYRRADNMKDAMQAMVIVNFLYAALNAQLLFGDLYNARLCNALHAFPLRRECWFTTGIVSGLVFSLVPNFLAALFVSPLLGAGMQMALWWFLSAGMQYIFFFGLAVLSVMCVGNRFAMILVYSIFNFLSPVLYWLVQTLYEPLLYGITVNNAPFILFSPLFQMTASPDLIAISRQEVDDGVKTYYVIKEILLSAGWEYLGICTVLGIIFGGLGLHMYRKRNLESAGDFMAFSFIEPVFQVLYTFCVGALFQGFGNIFGGPAYLFLPVGIVVGFFTGRMLLKRQVRIFQPKAFLGFAVLVCLFVVSLVLTATDVLGITRYIPAAADIRSVSLHSPAAGNNLTFDEPEDIDRILSIHEDALQARYVTPVAIESEITVLPMGIIQEYVTDPSFRMELHYTLNNGRVLSRYYTMPVDSLAGQIAKDYFTTFECVLGIPEDEIPAFADRITYFYVSNMVGEMPNPHELDLTGLLRAVAADCREGNMTQSDMFHPPYTTFTWVEFQVMNEFRQETYYSLRIGSDAAHAVQWLKDNGLYVEPEQEYKK